MRCLAGTVTLVLATCLLTPTSAQSPAAAETKHADAQALADIQARIDAYTAAFNKGDAKALAALWTETGELSTPGGQTFAGRAQLEQAFAKYFAETSGAKIELVDTNVEMLSPSVGVESGIARVIAPDQQPSESSYEAIHVKTADGWRVDRVAEADLPEPVPSHYEQLQALEWMVGTWANADDASSIETTCHWTTNQNFLVQTFRVYIADRLDFEGTQVIGWDPYAQTIRSWLFDSDGGFGVGRWSEGNGRWTVATLNVLPDGRRGSSTNVYELVDDSTVRFSSVGRQVDGELLPNIEPVQVARVPSP